MQLAGRVKIEHCMLSHLCLYIYLFIYFVTEMDTIQKSIALWVYSGAFWEGIGNCTM